MPGLSVTTGRQLYFTEDAFLKTPVSAIYIPWNIIQPETGRESRQMLQHGDTLRTLCPVAWASLRKIPLNSQRQNVGVCVPGTEEGRGGVSVYWGQGFSLQDEKRSGDWLRDNVNVFNSAELHTEKRLRW